MSVARKSWMVAASIGAVEALKDQGICRWNYTLRSLHQHAKNNIRAFAQAKMISSSSGSSSSSSPSSTVAEETIRNSDAKLNKREASMEKVMELSCWGPSTVRF